MAVSLHEHEGFDIRGQADLGEGFHAADGHAVEEFQGAGDDARGDDGGDGFGGGLHRVVQHQHGLAGCRAW